jgi:hypothetical protein
MFRLLSIFSFFLFLSVSSQAQAIKYDHSIDIMLQKDAATTHASQDVYVSYANGQYNIDFYLLDGKKIQHYSTHAASAKSFNKADYKWVSPAKAAIKLYNTTSADYLTLTVWQDQKGTGILVDKQ